MAPPGGDFSQPVSLGRTGLMVSRIGIGSSYGVPRRACLEAFDAGVNYFFWGSVRARGMALALREMASRERERLVVVLQCYARPGRWIERSVENGLRKLRLDHADVLLLGWYDRPPSERALQTVARLREAGRFRFLGVSSHQRPLLRRYAEQGIYDVLHLRYNAAHRGAESEIFAHLPPGGVGPGIVSFTNTRWGDLLKPKNMPADTKPPSAADCYRFALTHPSVQVAISGPRGYQQCREAVSVLRSSPMDEDELARMRAIGDHVHGVRSLMSLLG